MLEHLIKNYNDLNEKSQKKINDLVIMINDYDNILLTAKNKYQNKNFFKRLFAFSDRKKIKELIAFIDEKKSEGREEQKIVKLRKQEIHKEYAHQLMFMDNKDEVMKLNSHLKEINAIYEIINKTKKSGDYALSQIKSAANSVSDAETMETMDLVSSNKTMSLLSTMSTHDASDDVNNAKSAIESFQKNLEYMKTHVEQLKLDTTIENMDFIFDMFLDNGLLDFFGSLMALDSLEKASNSLVDAEKKVLDVMVSINKEHADVVLRKENQEKIIEDFQNVFFVQAKIELKKHKIIV